jgi:hypothetical protein
MCSIALIAAVSELSPCCVQPPNRHTPSVLSVMSAGGYCCSGFAMAGLPDIHLHNAACVLHETSVVWPPNSIWSFVAPETGIGFVLCRDLNGNVLTGPLPSSWSAMRRLKYMYAGLASRHAPTMCTRTACPLDVRYGCINRPGAWCESTLPATAVHWQLLACSACTHNPWTFPHTP